MKHFLRITSIAVVASLVFILAACTDGDDSDSGKDTTSHETEDFGLGIVMPEK